MNGANSRAPHFVAVCCQVETADIEAMEYWLNEAPMSDPAAANAIVFALQRLVRSGLSVRLEAGPPGKLAAQIGTDRVPLPDEWAHWWDRARQGRRVGPLTQTVHLPSQLLASPLTSLGLQSPKRRLRRGSVRAA